MESIFTFPMCWKTFIFICSIIGTFFNMLFFVFTLLIIMVEFDVMKIVLKSVFMPLDKVLATLLMTVIFIYWFTGIAWFTGTHKEYAFWDGPLPCEESLLSCFQAHFDFGWVNAPGFPGMVPDSMIVFNFTYQLIINLITTSIISGLIIDTFSAMREEVDGITTDTKSNCFICCKARDSFERLNIDF